MIPVPISTLSVTHLLDLTIGNEEEGGKHTVPNMGVPNVQITALHNMDMPEAMNTIKKSHCGDSSNTEMQKCTARAMPNTMNTMGNTLSKQKPLFGGNVQPRPASPHIPHKLLIARVQIKAEENSGVLPLVGWARTILEEIFSNLP